MEVQILHYYLRVFSFFFTIFIIFYFCFIFLIKDLDLKKNDFYIKKGQNINQIVEDNFNESKVTIFFYKTLLKLKINNTKSLIHFGRFKIPNNSNFISFINTITLPSQILEKITIIEGSNKKDLNKILSSNFNIFNDIEYDEVIADTYYFNHGSSFEVLKNKFKTNLLDLKNKYKNNILMKRFTFKEIMIVGSLLEKEGLDTEDKKKIFSVIINRLNSNMKLQIDASVIYSITRGSNILDRKLTYSDLKIVDNYNTYHIYGLPPKPISYVGLKTIELIFENYKSDFLFYFYNSNLKRHIYTKDYKNHLLKLNEYRSKK